MDKGHTGQMILYVFVGSTILMEFLYFLKIDVLKILVLLGTFALAMSFAGNDLVNFIGVPLAGLSSYQDFAANGTDPSSFLMSSLNESARTPVFILAAAGVIMIFALATSKKAQNVVKTSVDLSRQDEGDEMFGSSRTARVLVRMSNGISTWIQEHTSRPGRSMDKYPFQLGNGHKRQRSSIRQGQGYASTSWLPAC